jgi:hypothetical protein
MSHQGGNKGGDRASVKYAKLRTSLKPITNQLLGCRSSRRHSEYDAQNPTR